MILSLAANLFGFIASLLVFTYFYEKDDRDDDHELLVN